jgi:hypothetical protein
MQHNIGGLYEARKNMHLGESTEWTLLTQHREEI